VKRKGRIPVSGRTTTDRSIFEDPYKLKGRVLGMVRKDFKKSPMYAAAKKRAFLGDTVYRCEGCGQHFYTGTSDKNFEALKSEKYPDLIRGKESKLLDMDHIDSVVPYDRTTKDMTLDELIPRVYCHENNLQYICKEKCHKEKTAKEKSIRAKYAELKKLEEKC
jgi:hypothetical protein